MVDPVVSERRDFVVRGRVQGVGFRWSARRRAQELGLAGSVRNLPDGAVGVCALGSPAALDRFQRWLGEGPPGARVDSVEEVPSELPVPADGFHIVR